jgi:hypothetical protein
MLHYIVKQYTDDIFVYQNTVEYMTVKRSFDIFGKLTSKFFQDGKLILETGYDIFLFRKFLSIKYQNLPVSLELKKMKGNYILIQDSNFLSVKRKYFKNPLYQLYSNKEIKGDVNSKVNGFAETPTIYNVLFSTDSDVNFYLLLLFIINLPPTMDV